VGAGTVQREGQCARRDPVVTRPGLGRLELRMNRADEAVVAALEELRTEISRVAGPPDDGTSDPEPFYSLWLMADNALAAARPTEEAPPDG
jgi:hypothetical protein